MSFTFFRCWYGAYSQLCGSITSSANLLFLGGGDSSFQKFSIVVVSSDPLINLVDIVTDRVDTANAQLAEVAFDLRNKLMQSCKENLL
jgi:hypothetical protein